MALAFSAKGKQPTSRDEGETQPFLSVLFDRDDFLLSVSDSDEESEDDDDTYQKDDPRLFQQGASHELGSLPLRSPVESRSARPSPQRKNTVRSIYATHLMSRQPIVNTIRIHPNLDLRNLFGNLPFSSSVRANHYPPEIQNTQISNLFLPTWSMLPVNTRPDPGSLRYAVPSVMDEATRMIAQGNLVEHIIETHPNIAALFDEDEFNQSGILSRWAAGMVHSVILKGKHTY